MKSNVYVRQVVNKNKTSRDREKKIDGNNEEEREDVNEKGQ